MKANGLSPLNKFLNIHRLHPRRFRRSFFENTNIFRFKEETKTEICINVAIYGGIERERESHSFIHAGLVEI